MDTNETNIPLPPSTASQTFLRMQQPLIGLEYSKLISLEIEKAYHLLFEFVVPSEIPHHVCRHAHRHEQVHCEHSQLPPSMGSRCHLQPKHVVMKDMAPEGVDITYSICLRVFKTCRKTGVIRPIAEWRHPVHIHTSRQERAPLLIPPESRYYCFSKDKKVVGRWCRPLGILSIETAQPAAIQSHLPSGIPATTITANLQYTVIAGSPPPELLSIHPRLNILTFSSLEPWPDFPDLIDSSMCPYHNACNMQTVLLQPCQLRIEWQTLTSEKNLGHKKGLITYTASVQIPITFPEDMSVHLPTFFSCLFALTYSVRLSFLYHVEGQWGKASKVNVTVPVQIC